MKRFFLLLIATIGCIGTLSAQDIIVKSDGKKIEAKVSEISQTEVRYKRFSNPDGPTYVLPVGEILRIDYQNGESDTFGTTPKEQQSVSAEEVSAPTPTSAPVAEPAPKPEAQAVVYRVKPELGRVYDDNGVKGIVVRIDDDGMHGLMLSLTESDGYLPWTTLREPYPAVEASSKSDGRENVAAVERYIAENGLSWEDFPAFKWCRDLGDGWYLPAVDELLQVGFIYNGSQRVHYSRKACVEFNDKIKEQGGKKINPMVDHYTSTYMGEGNAVTCTMEIAPPYAHSRRAHEKYLVRAVRRF